MWKSKKKNIVALSLIISMLATMIPGTTSALWAANGPSITYSFANEKAGFAEGTITINSNEDGDYNLYFADDNGALKGYYEIATVKVIDGTGSFSFLPDIAIPAGATKVLAVSKKKVDKETCSNANYYPAIKDADVVYNIPSSKKNPNMQSDKTLSFEALSDTQLDYQSTVFYTIAEEHFAMALEDAADRNVDFITTSGDCINNYENGTSKEWQQFQKIIAQSSYTGYIFEGNGNHSMKSDPQYGLQAFTAATGLENDSVSIGDKPYYELTADNGDHFIFVALMTNSAVTNVDEFTTEELDWFEGLLEKYYGDGHNIFVFEHAFFQGWGPGDSKTKGYYNGGLRYSSEYPNNKRFKELFDKYKEIFMYAGHSHIDFQYNLNYDNENGQTAHMYHVPACACTTHIVNDKVDYTMYQEASQCYIVDVFPDMVISNGLNVVDNKIYPQYSYIVDTTEHKGIKNGEEEPEEKEDVPYVESTNLIDVQIVDATSSQYLLTSDAVLFLYNNDSGNRYEVDSQNMIAKIPENAKHLTLYRCNKEWGVGSKSDDICPGFYNVFGPYERKEGQVLFKVVSSSKANQNYWMEGTIDYGTEGAVEPEDPEEVTTPVTDVTLRWAIPTTLALDTIDYKVYLNDVSTKSYGDYVFTKTEETFTKADTEYTVYEYVLAKEKVEAINAANGLSRIQIKGIMNDGSKLQIAIFQYGNKTSKIADVTDLENKIALLADASWDTATKMSTQTRALADFITYPYVEEVIPEVVVPEGYIKLHMTDNTSTKYIFTGGAKVFVYDVNTAEHYEFIPDETGVAGDAVIPDSITDMIIYRCNGAFGVGGSDASKNDNGIGYWNKWVPAPHQPGWKELILGGASSSASTWIANIKGFDENSTFYLEGYFNGADYTGNDYQFDANGSLEMVFGKDSYVFVRSSDGVEYRTNGWLGNSVSSATLYHAGTMSSPDKLYVPAGKVRFQMKANQDGTITLKYTILHIDVDKSELTLASDDVIDAKYVADVSTMDKLTTEVERTLTVDYRYASFKSYIDMKRAYFTYLEKVASDKTAAASMYAELLTTYKNFCAAKEVNNIVTVYFCNDIPWTGVNVYAYNSTTGQKINTLETACGASLIKTLKCGVKVYEVTINQSIYDKIIFTNGEGQKTVVLDTPVNNHTGFYFSDSDLTATELSPKRFLYTYDEPAKLFANKSMLDEKKEDAGKQEEAEKNAGKIKIHVRIPADWSGVNAYVGTDSWGQLTGPWPGQAMTKETDGWYGIEVKDIAHWVVFKDAASEAQSVDIELQTGKEAWVVLEAVAGGKATGTVIYKNPSTVDIEKEIEKEKQQAAEKEAQKFANSYIMHVKTDASWGTPGYWAWNEAGNLFSAWPGQQMTTMEDGWYVIKVPKDMTGLIINGKEGSVQTKDLEVKGDRWLVVGADGTVLEYEAAPNASDIAAQLEKAQAEKAAALADTCKVYIKVDASWENPRYWAWNASGNLFATWPGEILTTMEDGWYVINLPKSMTGLIINGNDGSIQTADITMKGVSVRIVVAADGSYEMTSVDGEVVEKEEDAVKDNRKDAETTSDDTNKVADEEPQESAIASSTDGNGFSAAAIVFIILASVILIGGIVVIVALAKKKTHRTE